MDLKWVAEDKVLKVSLSVHPWIMSGSPKTR